MAAETKNVEKRLCIVVDNRIAPQTDFLREGISTSFQHYACELIAKYVMLSRQHSWLPNSLQIIGAGTPSTATNTSFSNQEDINRIQRILEPRFNIPSSGLMIKENWSNYLVSAISLAAKSTATSTEDKIVVVIYSTDMLLFGDETFQISKIVDGIKVFLQACVEIFQDSQLVEIRIVAGSINVRSDSNFANNNVAISIQEIFCKEVTNLGLAIQLDFLYVSSLQFDYELRTLVSQLIPDPMVALNLNSSSDPCKLYISLVPWTFTAADCVLHMTELEYCGTCHRNGINPLFIAGYGMEVRVPEKSQTRGHIGDQQYMYNYTLLQGLKNWLSRNDAILIVRVPYIFPGQTKLCSKFWALIPPLHQQGEAFHQQNMVLILLTDRDQLLSNDHKSFQSSRPLLLDELFEGFQQLLPSMISLPVSHMDFNPWTHIGGSLNAQFDCFRKSAEQQLVSSKSAGLVGPNSATWKPKAAAKQQVEATANLIHRDTPSSKIQTDDVNTGNSRGSVAINSRGGQKTAGGRSRQSNANMQTLQAVPKPRSRNTKSNPAITKSIQPQVMLPGPVPPNPGKAVEPKDIAKATGSVAPVASHSNFNEEVSAEENLFDIVQTSSRPRFLKRKFSNSYHTKIAQHSTAGSEDENQVSDVSAAMFVDLNEP